MEQMSSDDGVSANPTLRKARAQGQVCKRASFAKDKADVTVSADSMGMR